MCSAQIEADSRASVSDVGDEPIGNSIPSFALARWCRCRLPYVSGDITACLMVGCASRLCIATIALLGCEEQLDELVTSQKSVFVVDLPCAEVVGAAGPMRAPGTEFGRGF